MKKYYLLSFVLILFASWTTAQVTLNLVNSVPQPGSSYDFISTPSFSFNYNASGQNLVWDLSNVTGTSTTIDYILPSNAGDPGSYPNATIVESQGGAENYFQANSNGYSLLGQYSSGIISAVYTDPREFLVFPMSFGDAHNHTFSGTVESFGQIYDRSGTIIIDADAAGQLILPDTTIDDVLKVTLVTSYTDSLNGVQVASYQDSIITWYNGVTDVYLAAVTKVYTNGNPSGSQLIMLEKSDITIGIEDELEQQVILAYPNPSSGHVQLSEMISHFELYDLNGKLVMRSEGTPKRSIDTSELESGVYILHAIVSGKLMTERLIID